MNVREANVLLTKVTMLDHRWRRMEPAEQAERAAAWAEVLADIALPDALAALAEHYRVSTASIMPADIIDRCAPEDPWAHVTDYTAAAVEESKRAQLAAAGVTEAEWEANRHDRAWVQTRFSRTLEAGL